MTDLWAHWFSFLFSPPPPSLPFGKAANVVMDCSSIYIIIWFNITPIHVGSFVKGLIELGSNRLYGSNIILTDRCGWMKTLKKFFFVFFCIGQIHNLISFKGILHFTVFVEVNRMCTHARDQWHKQLSMSHNQYWANSTLPQDAGTAVRAVMSAGKVISQLVSGGSLDSVPVPRCLWLAAVAL